MIITIIMVMMIINKSHWRLAMPHGRLFGFFSPELCSFVFVYMGSSS
jgi:hypothetical protein